MSTIDTTELTSHAELADWEPGQRLHVQLPDGTKKTVAVKRVIAHVDFAEERQVDVESVCVGVNGELLLLTTCCGETEIQEFANRTDLCVDLAYNAVEDPAALMLLYRWECSDCRREWQPRSNVRFERPEARS